MEFDLVGGGGVGCDAERGGGDMRMIEIYAYDRD